MRHAVATAREAQVAHENLAWTQFMLAEECLRVGNIKDAEQSYQDALSSYNGYHLALAGLAKVRTAQGRFSDAIELYQRAMAVIPLPTYAAALGDVYKRVGRDADAKKAYDLVEYIGKLSALNKSVFNRELALFYADHDYKLEQSLQLARRELEVREDIYTWDVLAFALYKNGRFPEAAKAAAQAHKLGTRDSLLFFHAAMIYRKLGATQRAKTYFESALALNPHFHIFYAESARRELQEINSQTARTGDPALVNAARVP